MFIFRKSILYMQTYWYVDGFGGLVVSMLASGSRVQTRPKLLDFSDVKILIMPSFGGKVN
jgi:hypothetical protein